MNDPRGQIYDALLYLVPGAVLLVHENGQVARANSPAAALFGMEGGDRSYHLDDLFQTEKSIQTLLADARRTSDWVPARLQRRSSAEFLRVEARAYRAPDMPILFALRIQASVLTSRIFQELNDRVESLNKAHTKEIARRRQLQEWNQTLQEKTEQLSAEVQARQLVESQLTTVLNAVGQGIAQVDSGGRILMVNRQLLELFGYERDELIGQQVELLVPESKRSHHRNLRADYNQSPTTRAMGSGRDLWGRHKQGYLVPVEVGLNISRQGDDTHIVVTVLDVTERRRQQDELLKRTRSLERSNRELTDFAYIATHDLKEPLRGISNYSSFLLEDYEDSLDQDGKEMLNSLVRLSNRMEQFISELLNYSRVGQAELEFGPVDLNAVVQEVLEALAPRLRELQVQSRFSSALPKIACDRLLVRQVFMNLVSNAMKYNDKPERWIEVGSLHKDGRPVLFVRDNGIGVPRHLHFKIFKIFKRLHADDEFGGGTGVGLTLVKKIVERHGGKIWLESEPGEGTTFYFTLG